MATKLTDQGIISQSKKKQKSTQSAAVKQTTGLATRISASGFSPEKMVDKRNWFEKLTNLPEGQNALLDAIDLINRPQQSLFGGIESYLQGEDFSKGLKEGFTGNKRTTGSKILRQVGIGSEEKGDWADDILGFVLDVVGDPMNIPLPAVGKLGTFTKGADKVADAAKAGKVLWTDPTQILLKGASKGVKKGVGLTDDIVEKALTKIDARKGIEYVDAAAKRVGNLKPGVNVDAAMNFWKAQDPGQLLEWTKKVEKTGGALAAYKGVKNTITDTLAMASSLPKDFINNLRELTGRKGVTEEIYNGMRKQLESSIDDYVKIHGGTAKEVGDKLMGFLEFQNPIVRESISDLIDKGVTVPYTKEIGDAITELTKRLNIDTGFSIVKNADTGLKTISFSPDFRKIINQKVGPGEFTDLLDKTVSIKRIYTKEQLTQFKELAKNKEFLELFAKNKDIFNDMLEVAEITQAAQRTGKKLTNYARHSTTPQAQEILGELRKSGMDIDPMTLGKKLNKEDLYRLTEDTRVFRERKLEMSALESNTMFRNMLDNLSKSTEFKPTEKLAELMKNKDTVKLFETDLQSSVLDYMKKTPQQIAEAKKIDDLLVKSTFADKTLIKYNVNPYDTVTRGFARVDGNTFKDQLKEASTWLKSPQLEEVIKKVKSGPVEIDKRILHYVGHIVDGPKQTSALVNIYDKLANSFKGLKLLSPGFQFNNLVGNTSNMYLAGMNPTQIAKSYSDSSRIFKNAKLYQQMLNQGDNVLTKATKQMAKDYDTFLEFRKAGFIGDFANELMDITGVVGKDKDMTRNVLKKGFDKVTGVNAALNNGLDQYSRMAMFSYAQKNPSFIANLGLKNAAEAVRFSLFDYLDLSPNEQNVLKRVIPFYTFMKKNISFQMQNVINNPVRYTNLRKFVNSTWDAAGVDRKDAKDYELNNMWIPIPGLSKDGKYIVLKANLPMADFGEFLDAPVKKITASVSPFIKGPFEAVANKQLFTDMPIEDFAGQKGNMFKSDFFPGISRKAEFALSQTGLDVPLRTLYSPIASGYNFLNQEEKPFGSATEAIGEGLRILAESDVTKNQTAREYEILQRLQDGLRLVKQELGGPVPTMKDIQDQGLDTTELRKKMESMLSKYL